MPVSHLTVKPFYSDERNKVKFYFPLFQFGDSQKLRLVRILRSTVMVRVGGGWETLDEFLQKNDPCRGKYLKFLGNSFKPFVGNVGNTDFDSPLEAPLLFNTIHPH